MCMCLIYQVFKYIVIVFLSSKINIVSLVLIGYGFVVLLGTYLLYQHNINIEHNMSLKALNIMLA